MDGKLVAKRVKSKHPAADEVLDAYKKEVARARKFIVDKDVVDLPPGDDLEVIDTPPFMRTTVTAAYDAPPPFDPNVTKGFFFVTPIDSEYPLADVAAAQERLESRQATGKIVLRP